MIENLWQRKKAEEAVRYNGNMEREAEI